MKPVTADPIQIIDERIAELKKDLDAIKLCQHRKHEAIDELTALRNKLLGIEPESTETPAIANTTALGARRANSRTKYTIEEGGVNP